MPVSETVCPVVPIDGDQGALPLSYRETHLANGAWFLGLLRHALVANGVPQSRIAQETERDTTTINLMLSGQRPVAADVIAAVIHNDALGTTLSGISKRYGWESPRRRIEDLAREVQELREWKARAMALLADMPAGGQP